MVNAKIEFLRYIVYTLLLFLFIYQFRLEIIGLPPTIHSTRVGAIGIVLLGIFERNKNNKYLYSTTGILKYINLCVALFVYSLILMFVQGKGSGIHLLDTLLNNLLITIPVIWGLTNIFKDFESFLKVLILVGLLQTAFIILCLTNEPIQLLIDNAFNNVDTDGHNILILRNGYAGGIGCITAPGMIRYTTCLLASSYLYVKTSNIRYFLMFVMFAIINSMISRTGLLMDACCLCFIVLQQNKSGNFFNFLIWSLLFFGILYIIIGTGKYDNFISERFHRYSNLKESGLQQDFFDGYFGGEIPTLLNNLVLGTGIVSGIASDGTIVNVDGGPLRIYSAAGLLIAIVIYSTLLKIMIKNIRIQKQKVDREFMFLLLVYLVIADFKEITFFIAWPLSIYFTITILIYKKNSSLFISRPK